MAAPELQLVTDLASRLASHGRAELVYLTAEFQPFSNAQRPDLVFVPSSGGWAGQRAVVEFKVEPAPRTTGRSFLNLIEHKEFCEEALEAPIFRYVFVTNQEVPEFSVAQLRSSGIAVVAYDGDIQATADAILRELVAA
jgi:hypothetical protein